LRDVTVNPGDYFSVTLNFKAPEKLDKHCAFYRFTHGVSKKFGDKYWCDIKVIPAPPPPVMPAPEVVHQVQEPALVPALGAHNEREYEVKDMDILEQLKRKFDGYENLDPQRAS